MFIMAMTSLLLVYASACDLNSSFVCHLAPLFGCPRILYLVQERLCSFLSSKPPLSCIHPLAATELPSLLATMCTLCCSVFCHSQQNWLSKRINVILVLSLARQVVNLSKVYLQVYTSSSFSACINPTAGSFYGHVL